MSTLQVTKITTVDNTTPLILATGNAGGGQIIVQSANTDVFFNGNIRFSNYVTGDGSGLYIPSSNVANAAFDTANAAFASANNVAPQVTPAYNTANAAFNTANAAFASANNVAPQVTPAFNTANAAFGKANTALQNTDGVIFNGSLTVANTLTSGNINVTGTTTYLNANSIVVSGNVTAAYFIGNGALLTGIVTDFSPAYNTANAAFNTANAAYGQSNTISSSLTSNWAVGNIAYGVANAAYGYANVSNTYAESTFLKLTAPSQTVTGNLTVTGNFTLLGNATTISSNNLIVGDSMIYLAANNYSGTDILDIGFVANYANGTGANVHTGLLREIGRAHV